MADENQELTPVADWRDAYTNIRPGAGVPESAAGDPDIDTDARTITPLELFPVREAEFGLPEPAGRAPVRTTHNFPVQVHDVTMDTEGNSATTAGNDPQATQFYPAHATDHDIFEQTNGVINDYSGMYSRAGVHPAFQSQPYVNNPEVKTYPEHTEQVRLVFDDKEQRWAGAVLVPLGKPANCSKCGRNVPHDNLERNSDDQLVCKPGKDERCKAVALTHEDAPR